MLRKFMNYMDLKLNFYLNTKENVSDVKSYVLLLNIISKIDNWCDYNQ